MPGHHRRNYFSCFLVPGAGHSVSALIPPKPSHVLSSGTPVEELVGMGHTAPLSSRPSFFPPPLRPSCRGQQSGTSTGCPRQHHSSLSATSWDVVRSPGGPQESKAHGLQKVPSVRRTLWPGTNNRLLNPEQITQFLKSSRCRYHGIKRTVSRLF